MPVHVTETAGTKMLKLQQGNSRYVSGGAAGNFTSIPIVDLSPLINPAATADDKQQLVLSIRDACTRVGFFIIKNHGIQWEIVENAFDGLEEFFNLPLETKMEIHQDASPSFMGYEQMYYTNVDGLSKGGQWPMHALPFTEQAKLIIASVQTRRRQLALPTTPKSILVALERMLYHRSFREKHPGPRKRTHPRSKAALKRTK